MGVRCGNQKMYKETLEGLDHLLNICFWLYKNFFLSSWMWIYKPKSETGPAWKLLIKRHSVLLFFFSAIADSADLRCFVFCLVNYILFINNPSFLHFRPAKNPKYFSIPFCHSISPHVWCFDTVSGVILIN